MKKTYKLIALLLIISTLCTCGVFSAAAEESAPPYLIEAYDAYDSYDAGTKTTQLIYPDNAEEYAIGIKPTDENTVITVYADSRRLYPIAPDSDNEYIITPKQMDTYIYVTAKTGNQAEQYRICLRSRRSSVKYPDYSSISTWAKPYINYCNELGYGIIQGDNFGNIHPLHSLTRYEIALIAARMMGTDCSFYANYKLTYSDRITNWAKDGVTAMTANGIIAGNKYGNKYYYDGDSNVTREQVAKIMVNLSLLRSGSSKTAEQLYNANKAKYEKTLNTFADQSKISAWARPYVAVAVCDLKLMTGSKEADGKTYVHPRADISRQEMITMVAREMGYDITALLQDLLITSYEIINRDDLNAVTAASLTKAYNTARAAFNGSNTAKKESAYIALYEKVRPYLTYDETAKERIVIYLSPSNQTANEYTGVATNEGAQMQAVAALLKPKLEAMGFTVVIADPNSRIFGREDEAKKVGADIYVAIHSNATGIVNNGSWQGSIVFHSNNPGSKELAECINQKLSALTPTKDKGLVNDGNDNNPYHEIIAPSMANVLVEVEYHDYEEYAKWIVNNKDALAQAFADGILQYYLNKAL